MDSNATFPSIRFAQSSDVVDTYDFIAITLCIDAPNVDNPFTEAKVTGSFQLESTEPIPADGFCDSDDGTVYRIRFMPTRPGSYVYTVSYHQGDLEKTHQGTFEAREGTHRGLVRVDKEYPWHFIWEGTGEHFFWNGTTTYWLLGWKDDQIIQNAIDRLVNLKVNRLRVGINGRVKDGRDWYENVFPTDAFSFRLNPWVAQSPDSVEDPGFDVTRFNVGYWQKIERMLHHAREKDMVVSIVFYVDGAKPGVDPFKLDAGGDDERRYYRHAAARLSAFSNIMWDVTNEYRLFRDDAWAEGMGRFLKSCDPYDHLMSVHGHDTFRFRTSPWADFAMYQAWDEHGGYPFMLDNRLRQRETGRIIPQVNEEYGYEDHYPGAWGEGRTAPARSADNRRRLAWEMYMAGCYQTTGERADTGTGWGPDTGGGWINGRGDDSMVMLNGYGHIVDFFHTFEWWKTRPCNELVSSDAMCLAEPERLWVIYSPSGGDLSLEVEAGMHVVQWFNPRTGEFNTPQEVYHNGGDFQLESPDDSGDMAVKVVVKDP